MKINSKLLNTLISTYEKLQIKIRDEGLNFNIFSILNLNTKEVTLHTPILHALLDKKETHGEGATFCKLFIDTICDEINQNIPFDFTNYTVHKEMSLGEIDGKYKNGGSIDLYLDDQKGNCIIIENKIYAGDQYKQLIRYRNFNPNSTILYLTLNGSLPSNNSIGKELLVNRDFYCISYNNTISKWLQKCSDQINKHSLVYSTIFQYQMVIDQLTLQNKYNYIYMAIREQMLKNKELFMMASEINETYNNLKKEIVDELVLKVVENKNNNRSIYITPYKFKLYLEAAADDTAVFISFVLKNDRNKNDHKSATAKRLKNLITEVLGPEVQPDVRFLYSIYLKDIKVYNLSDEQLSVLLDKEQRIATIQNYNKIIHDKVKLVEEYIKKNTAALID